MAQLIDKSALVAEIERRLDIAIGIIIFCVGMIVGLLIRLFNYEQSTEN